MHVFGRFASTTLTILLLGGCGGGGNSSAPVRQVLGVTVSGLEGTGLVLRDQTGQELTIDGDGQFTFSGRLADGDAYRVEVARQPTARLRTGLVRCSAASASGTMGGAAVSVEVGCRTTAFFVGEDPDHGEELWMTDGTPDGTFLVKDIWEGAEASMPRTLTAWREAVYFMATDGETGWELWKSDGTEAGTSRLADTLAGPDSGYPSAFTPCGALLCFTVCAAGDSCEGATWWEGELWRTDGTPEGTRRIAGELDRWMTGFGGEAYFRSNAGPSGDALWKTDGTETGTVLVKDVREGSLEWSANQFVVMGDRLYFYAESDSGLGLWKTDGTTAGTVRVKDLKVVGGLTAVGDTLYFSGMIDEEEGPELWKSGGTEETTFLVKDIQVTSRVGSYPREFTSYAGAVYFSAHESGGDYQLWRTDGTEAGTTQVTDAAPAPSPSSLTVLDDWLYFVGTDPATGIELWRSDGTTAGTRPFLDVVEGPTSSAPNALTVVNGALLFSATDGTGPINLWRADVGSQASAVNLQPGSRFIGFVAPYL